MHTVSCSYLCLPSTEREHLTKKSWGHACGRYRGTNVADSTEDAADNRAEDAVVLPGMEASHATIAEPVALRNGGYAIAALVHSHIAAAAIAQQDRIPTPQHVMVNNVCQQQLCWCSWHAELPLCKRIILHISGQAVLTLTRLHPRYPHTRCSAHHPQCLCHPILAQMWAAERAPGAIEFCLCLLHLLHHRCPHLRGSGSGAARVSH